MPELEGLRGRKRRVYSLTEASLLVSDSYPRAYPEGGIAHWLWSEQWIDRQGREPLIVAEMWPVRGSSRYWWLRIRDGSNAIGSARGEDNADNG
jgi:hypothetical protein